MLSPHRGVLGVLPVLGLVGQIAGRHEEGEEEMAVLAVGGVVAAGDHGVQAGLDADVIGEVRGGRKSALWFDSLCDLLDHTGYTQNDVPHEDYEHVVFVVSQVGHNVAALRIENANGLKGGSGK